MTSPGRAVRALVTDLGLLEKANLDERAELRLTAVPAGARSIADRVAAARSACGWELAVVDDVVELPLPSPAEVLALRSWDPRGWFLRSR